jgi:hypothetical protein
MAVVCHANVTVSTSGLSVDRNPRLPDQWENSQPSAGVAVMVTGCPWS